MTSRSPSSSPDPIVLPSSPPSAHLYRDDVASSRERRRTNAGRIFRQGTPRTRLRTEYVNTPNAGSPASTAAARHRTKQQNRRLQSITALDGTQSDGLDELSPQRPAKRTRLSQQPRHSEVRSQSPHKTADAPADLIDPALDAMPMPRQEAVFHSPIRTRNQKAAAASSAIKSSTVKRPDVSSPLRRKALEPSGEHTMANEDFTMISGDSLASIKANNSIFGASQSKANGDATSDDAHKDVAEDHAVVYPDLNDFDAEIPMYTPATTARGSSIQQSPVRSVRSARRRRVHRETSNEPQAEEQHDQNGAHSNDMNGRINDVVMRDVEEDIWAVEASRSIEENGIVTINADKSQADTIPPIFASTVQPPPRSKIPGTWRRASGEDFAYSDSPARIVKQTSSTTDRQHSRKNGASASLLSPTTADEEFRRRDHASESTTHDGEGFEFTEPDAAATQLQEENDEAEYDMAPMRSASSSDTDDDVLGSSDTGVFWENYQPTRTIQQLPTAKAKDFDKSPNLSNIFNSDTSNFAAKQHSSPRRVVFEKGLRQGSARPSPSAVVKQSRLLSQSPRRPPSHAPELTELLGTSGRASKERLLETPPKRMDHKNKTPKQVTSPLVRPRQAMPESELGEDEDLDDQNYSDDVDEEADEGSEDIDAEEDPQDAEIGQDEIEDTEPSRSYEEHLNLGSPGKVKVRFDDSILIRSDHNPLRPSRVYPPLFDNAISSARKTMRPSNADTANNADPRKSSMRARAQETEKPGLFSKLTTSLWSAIVRPTEPTYVDPPREVAKHIERSIILARPFPGDLRAQLRARYGIVANQHPWTMLHMRTLHRMFNSLIQRPDSIVPTTVPLPRELDDIINTMQYSATYMPFTFRYTHACVVNAFMQVLVPVNVLQMMERGQIEWLGDDITESYRGVQGGRAASDLCFKTVETPNGNIELPWVVSCIGCILYANRETKKREEEEERLRALYGDDYDELDHWIEA